MKLLVFTFLTNMIIGADINYYLQNNQKVYLEKIDANSIQNQKPTQIKLYKKENGKLVGLKNQFFIKLKIDSIISFIRKYNLKLIKLYKKNLYLVETNNSDILKTINTIYNDKNTTYAYPNFLRKVEQR